MENNPYLSYPKKESALAEAVVALLNQIAELLKQLLAGLGNPARRHGLLRPEEVMTMLCITDRTLRRYNQQGILRPIRFGGMYFYLMDEIIASGKGDATAG